MCVGAGSSVVVDGNPIFCRMYDSTNADWGTDLDDDRFVCAGVDYFCLYC